MKQFIEKIAHPLFAISSLALLIFLFIGVIYWVYFRVSKATHERHAQIPLQEDNEDRHSKDLTKKDKKS